MIIIVPLNGLRSRTEERGPEFLQNQKIPLINFVDMLLNALWIIKFCFWKDTQGSLSLSLIRKIFRNVMVLCTYVAEMEQTLFPDYAL